jgi:hypothetical protein
MPLLTFLIQGSAAEPYRVTFRNDYGEVTASCSCPAGIFRRHCKHRIGIMSGEVKGMVSGNLEDMATVQEWVRGTPLEALWMGLQELESELAALNSRIRKQKKLLADELNGKVDQ